MISESGFSALYVGMDPGDRSSEPTVGIIDANFWISVEERVHYCSLAYSTIR